MVPGLFLACLLACSIRGEVVFSLDVGEFTDITMPLFHSEGTEPVIPSAGTTGSAIEFTHTGSVSADTTDVVSQWAVGTGDIPRDFSPVLGPRWQITWRAFNSPSTATDRMNVYLGSTHNGSGLENYPLGFQTSANNATASAQGVKLVVGGVKTVVNDEAGVTPLNGSVERSYRLVIDESASTYTALVDQGEGFYSVGSGPLPFSSDERRVFFGIRDRQPQQGLNEVGTIVFLDIENLAPPADLPQIVVFDATPETITPGNETELSWAVTNFTGLSITPGVGDVTSLTTNGSGHVVVAPSLSTTYTLTATNLEGTSTATRLVTVQVPVPTIHSFVASPSLINTGQTATLSWSVSGADQLSLSPTVGDVTGQSSIQVQPLSNTVYTLTASNGWGISQAQTEVRFNVARPNFLFIAIDDLKPIAGFMSENPGNFLSRIYPSPAKRAQIRSILTPNIDALAASGVAFHRAYCPASVCRPSRTALMTGYRPNESGVTGNSDGYFRQSDKPAFLRKVITLPQLLKANGYFTGGSGKIFHTGSDEEADYTGVTIDGTHYDSWNTWFSSAPSTGNRGNRVTSPWSPSGIEIEFGYDSGPLEGQGDFATADLIARLFEEPSVTVGGRTASLSLDRPFFVACGIFRPHLPFYMPKALLDLFNVDDITASRGFLDEMYADLDDVNGGGGLNSGDMHDVRERGNTYGASIGIAEGDVRAYKETVRHYLAASALADRCVKRVLDAVDASPYASNTVVILWSDHGWFLGEKYLFRKTTLWDEACNNVLIIRDPRPGQQAAPGSACYRTVSLQDLYPTVASLAGVARPPHVRGYDISPLLVDPQRPWNIPAQTSMGDVAIRYGRWSFLKRSPDELYDVANDPDEIVNLINDAAYTPVKNMMNTLLTRSVANDPFLDRDIDSLESWQLGWFGWLTNRPAGPAEDPDGDDVPNEAEYVRFGHPLASDPAAGEARLVRPGGRVGLRFDMRDMDEGIVYEVEGSTNLVEWSAVWMSSDPAALEAATVTGAGSGRRTVEVGVPAVQPQEYLRVKAQPR